MADFYVPQGNSNNVPLAGIPVSYPLQEGEPSTSTLRRTAFASAGVV